MIFKDFFIIEMIPFGQKGDYYNGKVQGLFRKINENQSQGIRKQFLVCLKTV